MQIIKDLFIETENYTCENNILSDLSRINIFVGANNSGKSRFLRSIFYSNSGNKLKFLPYDNRFYEFQKQIEIFKSNETKNSMQYNTQDIKQTYNSIYNLIDSPKYLFESEELFTEWKSFYDKNHNRLVNFDMNIENLTKEYFTEFDFNDNDLFKYTFYKIYIPSLRGLLPLIPKKDITTKFNQTNSISQYLNEDVFAQRIKQDYFGENSNIITDVNNKSTQSMKHSIISGHYFYRYVQEFLLGNLEQREIIKEYQEYLSKNFFKGETVTLIPKLDDDVLTVKIGNEVERKIYNLGEGIQSIILITLPLFLYLDKVTDEQTNILVFIEEPEIGLHPAMQRKLMDTFLDERFENFQFFFTTHSNHFIDNIFKDKDISIFSFDKNIVNDTEVMIHIENVSFNHLPTLEKLGALPSAVLMSNCVILVEGSLDVEHYEYYLKLYQEHLKESASNIITYAEGTHYSFLRGGGSEGEKTLKEWNIKNRLFYIVDADDETTKQKKLQKFNELNFSNFHILKVREVENLLSKEVLIKILNNMDAFDELDINENFEIDEYKHYPFYKFIEEEILNCENLEKYIKKKELKKQLVIKEKEYITNYDNLTPETKEVIEEMYEFIKRNNP